MNAVDVRPLKAFFLSKFLETFIRLVISSYFSVVNILYPVNTLEHQMTQNGKERMCLCPDGLRTGINYNIEFLSIKQTENLTFQ